MPFSKRKRKDKSGEIAPDEIFLDSSNLPDFNTHQFEGRLEKPIPRRTATILAALFVLVGLGFTFKLWLLQVNHGAAYSRQSEQNRLRQRLYFSERGVIYDRNGKLLAWNVPNTNNSDFAERKYTDLAGLSHVLGYLKYPAKDKSGYYYTHNYEGIDGVEKFYDADLQGVNGIKLFETDALGKIVSENVVELPKAGDSLHLSVDAEISNKLYSTIKETAEQIGFTGGAAAIIDVRTGEMLALTSYPEFKSEIMSSGKDQVEINTYLKDAQKPFLDRVVDGLYTPGSIIKPFMALAALQENIIDEHKQILSAGSISIPNPYDSTKETVFNDWRAHGYVDMRRALEVSSDVYFYEIGGGYQDQKGLGIERINKYMRMFGFGSSVSTPFFAGGKGVIPTPEWKEETFHEPWRIGDTYNSSIGQYGWQVTPMQALIGVSLVATDGRPPEPTILKKEIAIPIPDKKVPMDDHMFGVVKEGMRHSVETGTASALAISSVKIAAKTGTAELGTTKQFVNSWITGFFPYEHPKYAFVVLMEKGARSNLIGAPYVARQFFDWLSQNRPDIIAGTPSQ